MKEWPTVFQFEYFFIDKKSDSVSHDNAAAEIIIENPIISL